MAARCAPLPSWIPAQSSPDSSRAASSSGRPVLGLGAARSPHEQVQGGELVGAVLLFAVGARLRQRDVARPSRRDLAHRARPARADDDVRVAQQRPRVVDESMHRHTGVRDGGHPPRDVPVPAGRGGRGGRHVVGQEHVAARAEQQQGAPPVVVAGHLVARVRPRVPARQPTHPVGLGQPPGGPPLGVGVAHPRGDDRRGAVVGDVVGAVVAVAAGGDHHGRQTEQPGEQRDLGGPVDDEQPTVGDVGPGGQRGHAVPQAVVPDGHPVEHAPRGGVVRAPAGVLAGQRHPRDVQAPAVGRRNRAR